MRLDRHHRKVVFPRQPLGEIADIDEDIGRHGQVMLIGLHVEERDDIAFDEAVADALPALFEPVGPNERGERA